MRNDTALDRMLTDWTARHALSPLRAAAIREAVIASPPIQVEPLAEGWWDRFASSLSANLWHASYVVPLPRRFAASYR